MKYFISLWMVVALLAVPVFAQTVTYEAITNDADSGISSLNTYTHAIDFGTNITPTVNGVNFTRVNDLAALNSQVNFNYQVDTGDRLFHTGNTAHNTSGDVGNLFRDMMYNGANTPGGNATVTISGLLRGAEYEQRIYTRQWASGSDRTSNITFSNLTDTNLLGAALAINEDNASLTPPGFAAANQAYALTLNYTADTPVLATNFEQINNNQSWHLYGLTNELVSLGNSADYLEIPAFNTGVDAGGNVLAPGSPDPNWTVTDPSNNTMAAIVALNHPSWSANDTVGGPGSSWISVTDDGANGIPVGEYTYSTQFDLTGFDIDSALIEMLIGNDNDVTDVLINGTSTGLTSPTEIAGYSTLILDSGFVEGINTLELIVDNDAVGSQAGGLRVQLSGTALASSSVPEPASVVIWSLMFLSAAVFWQARRRRLVKSTV